VRQLNLQFQTKDRRGGGRGGEDAHRRPPWARALRASPVFQQIHTSGAVDQLEERLQAFGRRHFGRTGLPPVGWEDFLVFVRCLKEQKWKLLNNVFHVPKQQQPPLVNASGSGFFQSGEFSLVPAGLPGSSLATAPLASPNNKGREREPLPALSPKQQPQSPSTPKPRGRLSSTAPAAVGAAGLGATTKFAPDRGALGGVRPSTVALGEASKDGADIFLATLERRGGMPGVAKSQTERNLYKLMETMYTDEELSLAKDNAFCYRNEKEARRRRQRELASKAADPDVEPRSTHRLCGLCRLAFAGDSFPASCSLKVLSNLFKRWGAAAQLRSFGAKLTGNVSQYHRLPLCTFCAQFVDPDRPDGLASRAGAPRATATAGFTPFYDDRYPLSLGVKTQKSTTEAVLSKQRSQANTYISLRDSIHSSAVDSNSNTLGESDGSFED